MYKVEEIDGKYYVYRSNGPAIMFLTTGELIDWLNSVFATTTA